MQVVRLEHPADQRGPFWSNIKVIPRDDMDEFMRQVKGTGPDGQSLDGLPEARAHNVLDEVEEAYRKHDVAVIHKWEHVAMDSKSTHGYNTPEDLVFGMAKAEDFDYWFPPKAKEIAAKYGYKKAVYEVPDDEAVVLYSQAAWKRKDGKLIEYQNLINQGD